MSPAAKDAMPVATLSTVASPAAAGPAAAGPMTGERKPKMPANVSPAEAVIYLSTLANVPADAAAEPVVSAPVRAATPWPYSDVFTASPVTNWATIRPMAPEQLTTIFTPDR